MLGAVAVEAVLVEMHCQGEHPCWACPQWVLVGREESSLIVFVSGRGDDAPYLCRLAHRWCADSTLQTAGPRWALQGVDRFHREPAQLAVCFDLFTLDDVPVAAIIADEQASRVDIFLDAKVARTVRRERAELRRAGFIDFDPAAASLPHLPGWEVHLTAAGVVVDIVAPPDVLSHAPRGRWRHDSGPDPNRVKKATTSVTDMARRGAPDRYGRAPHNPTGQRRANGPPLDDQPSPPRHQHLPRSRNIARPHRPARSHRRARGRPNRHAPRLTQRPGEPWSVTTQAGPAVTSVTKSVLVSKKHDHLVIYM